MSDRKPPAPRGLKRAGKALFHAITSDLKAYGYQLDARDQRLLLDACREADLIERLETELTDAPLTTKGSMGQLVASPLVSELRMHRATLASLLGRLDMDVEDDTLTLSGSTGYGTPNAARAAANARWHKK